MKDRRVQNRLMKRFITFMNPFEEFIIPLIRFTVYIACLYNHGGRGRQGDLVGLTDAHEKECIVMKIEYNPQVSLVPHLQKNGYIVIYNDYNS